MLSADCLPSAGAACPAHHDHVVQFYEGAEFLDQVVATYLREGLELGHAAVLVVTPARRAGVTRLLLECGLDPQALAAAGRLAWHDAAATLGGFMRDGMPDRDGFRAAVGPALQAAHDASGGRRVYAFGEMVNLLVADGNPRAALALEDHWNELAAERHFALLCAYDMRGFTSVADAETFRSVCGTHAHVVPAERFTRAIDADAQSAEVARLQQRAAALEAEVARARALEAQLRDALAAQARAAEERRLIEAHLQEVQRLESIGVLAGGIAHDFNNLLASILGNAELIAAMLPRGSELHVLASEIMLAGQRSADLTRQLLAYAGRGQFVLAPVDTCAVVREVVSLLRSSVPPGGIVEVDVPAGSLTVRGDRSQLVQVAMNLVMNAAEALEGRPGTIAVTVVEETLGEAQLVALASETLLQHGPLRPGAYVRLTVRDDGCGIPEELRARIFDPFFTTKPSGRGLGLAATRGIVRSHGGALQLASAPGRGTRFDVWLPIEVQAAAEPDGATVVAPSRRGRCLLVDDEPAVRRTIARLLRVEGWEVLEAEDGVDAVVRFDAVAGEVDLALLDLTMPTCGGLDARRHLRERAPSLPVILMSGFTDQWALGADAEGEGTTAFLEKPFGRNALATALAALLPVTEAA